MVKKITTSEINRFALAGTEEMQRFDRQYAAVIGEIAKSIYAQRHEKSMILLSGPSGSGKTTSALMLEAALDAMGAETHTISMDNYFIPFTQEQKLLLAQGKIDFESPNRVDIPFLNEQMEAFAACKPVHLPIYNFERSERSFKAEVFQRQEGEIVLLEGIHALNPSVICLPEGCLSNVYVSVRTRIDMGRELLHPSYVRLLRRLIRDKRCRARSYQETIDMYEGVERGEMAYIAPYKYRAHYEINSFHPYELSVYKAILGKELLQFRDEPRLSSLLKVLSLLQEIEPSSVPEHSLIREFVGEV